MFTLTLLFYDTVEALRPRVMVTWVRGITGRRASAPDAPPVATARSSSSIPLDVPPTPYSARKGGGGAQNQMPTRLLSQIRFSYSPSTREESSLAMTLPHRSENALC